MTLSFDGELEVIRGLVSRKQEKKRAGENGAKADEPKGISQSLLLALKAFRLQVAEVAIASHPDLAYDLLVFSAALPLLDRCGKVRRLHISFHDKTPIMGDVKDTHAAKAMAVCAKGSYLMAGRGKGGRAVRGVPQTRRHVKGPHTCLLRRPHLKAELAPSAADDMTAHDISLSLSEIDVAGCWRPTAENYLQRLTKTQLLEIGGEVFNPAWAKRNQIEKNRISRLS